MGKRERTSGTGAGKGNDTAEGSTTIPGLNNLDTDEIREETDFTGEVTFDRKLRDWLSKENYENLSATVTLYKFDNPATGTEKAQCGQWSNEIPDSHTIGLTYGSGRYLVLVTTPEGAKQAKAIKGYRFRLHTYYDELRRQAIAAGSMPLLPGASGSAAYSAPAGIRPGPAGGSLEGGLSLVREVLGIIMPILEVRGRGAAPVDDMLMGQYSAMSKMLNKNLMDNHQMLLEMKRNEVLGADPAGIDEVDDEEKPSIIEQLSPLIQKFLPLLLGNTPAAAATAATVRAIPDFKRIMGNPGEVGRIVAYLDNAIGKDKTDIVLRRLKVNRPGSAGPRPAAPGPRARPAPARERVAA